MRALLVSLLLVACGDPDLPAAETEAGVGGAQGVALQATGGATATGGSQATGGAAVVLSTTGGAAPATGGAATGGFGTGGSLATGGASTGGKAATGGAATGGLPATGGAATGGLAATGGVPNRCPAGITGAEYFDANGQCWSRIGTASDANGHNGGTLIGYPSTMKVQDAIDVLGPRHASLGCETKVILQANGKVFWCGSRLVPGSSNWITEYNPVTLPSLVGEFWTLSIEEVNSGACVLRC